MKLKNLTPKNLKGSRWEDFFQAIDNYFTDFKNNKISILKNKFAKNSLDKDNLRDLVKQKGYNVIELNGYSSTLEYIQRRSDSLPIEILWLLSETCYKYILKSFWYYGNIYGLFGDPTGYYFPIDISLTVSSIAAKVPLLDQEMDIIYYYYKDIPVPNPPEQTFLPAIFLDMDDPPFLDMDFKGNATNHFVIEYSFHKAESLDIFVSENTSRALYDTVSQVHRLKETPHFRVLLPFTVYTNGEVKEFNYSSYENQNEISIAKTIYLGGNFNLLTYIEIGDSYHSVIDNTITNCKQSLGIIPISQVFTINSQSVSGVDIEYKIKEYGKFANDSNEVIYSFSEVTFLDNDLKPIAYMRFPKITWYNKMYTSVHFKISGQDI